MELILSDDAGTIDRFAAGGERLRRAVAGLDPADLHAHRGPGEWSIQELVIHLAHSDAIAIDRMKRVIAEDRPTLLSADESAYVARLACDRQSLEDALTLFDTGRRQFARVLRALPREAFDRVGMHNVSGLVTVRDLLRIYTDHLEHHLEFLLRKRERLGKPAVA
jgi:uncharacterized damage-inducible protein DinB